MKLTAILFAAFSITGTYSIALASDDALPDAAPVNVVPAASTDIVVEQTPASPITFAQRLAWFDTKTFGPANFLGTLPGAAWNTGLNRPHEGGPHWEGFGERYGTSMATNAISNTIEASLGAAWGEDPRYLRAGETAPTKSRLGHVVKMTFLAQGRNGELRPAYARYIAYSSSSFISDAFREPSDTTLGNEIARIGLSFLGRMGGNAFDEFWPDTKRKFFHHGPKDDEQLAELKR